MLYDKCWKAAIYDGLLKKKVIHGVEWSYELLWATETVFYEQNKSKHLLSKCVHVCMRNKDKQGQWKPLGNVQYAREIAAR